MTTGHDMAAFASLDEVMESRVRDRGAGGAAWAVSVGGDTVSGSAGWLDPDRRDRPMPADGVFRIASVSKPIVAIAALQLVDAGLVGLDDPVDDVLPELADRQVLVDDRGPVDGQAVPAERSLTLRDLLTFRCGLGMEFDFTQPQPIVEQMWEWGVGPGPTPPDCDPDEYMARLGRLPLADQPGTRWRYHTGSDIVSVFIERVRGESLEVVLDRDVLTPLGMVDTGFTLHADHLDRVGACRTVNDDGELEIWDTVGGRWSAPPSFRSGATGLVSTTADLVTFGRMLLAGGVDPDAPGARILSRPLVDEMITDQLTDEQRSAARIDDVGAALGWGLGLGVRREAAPGGWPSVGAYAWDGGLGSRWLVDPETEVCAVILSTDAFETPSAPALMDDFVDAVAAALR